MRVYRWMVMSILSASCCGALAQANYRQAEYPRTGIPRSQSIESRQGYPNKPDVIAHKHIAKGTHLACSQVEHYPKHVDDGAACVLKFENGEKQTLGFGLESKVPADGEMYLECAGDKPTSCTVWWWRD